LCDFAAANSWRQRNSNAYADSFAYTYTDRDSDASCADEPSLRFQPEHQFDCSFQQRAIYDR
jgi:hypothetical protein